MDGVRPSSCRKCSGVNCPPKGQEGQRALPEGSAVLRRLRQDETLDRVNTAKRSRIAFQSHC